MRKVSTRAAIFPILRRMLAWCNEGSGFEAIFARPMHGETRCRAAERISVWIACRCVRKYRQRKILYRSGAN
jgi:hypothetical protein